MVSIFFLSIFLSVSNAFVPSQESAFGRPHDFSHASITELGLYQAASVYITNYLHPDQNSTNSDALHVIGHYFAQDLKSYKTFGTAIAAIVHYNNAAQMKYGTIPMRTMNSEQIDAGNTLLKSLRNLIITQAKSQNPNWDFIRQKIGEYLFTLQMFYSNTNWVELFGNTSCKELGIDGKNIIPTAPPSEAACSSCNYTLPKDEESACVDNMILDINYLTSGYLSYQGVNKPLDPRWTDGWGKCSHGGVNDLTKDTIAIGGINKETSDPTLSPHYYLHQAAGQAAVQATIDFFVGNGTGLLDQIGPDAFNKLLQMHYEEPCYQCFTPDKSLVFVIDNTGSMGNDIFEVRKKAIEIVTFSQSSSTKPFNYILATFNDPDTTLTVTTDGNVLIQHLNALTAEGGDDCPEMAMAGLIRGIQHAKPGSCVFFFTDADAKDTEKESQVEALIQSKRIKLALLLRGTCDGVLPNKTKETQQQSQDGCLIRNTRVMSHSGRKRRSGLGGLGLYESLAGGTGSVIAHVSKDTLGSVLDSIVKHNLGIATINIEKFITSNATTSVPVDSDLNLVTIKIKGIYDADHVSLVSPDGNGNQGTVDDVGHQTVIINVMKPKPGIWKLQNTGGKRWNIDVTGSGSTSVTFKFMEKKGPYYYPISGSSPISGTELSLSVTVASLVSDSHVTSMFFTSATGDVIWRSPVYDKGINPTRKFIQILRIPTQSFYVNVDGVRNGTRFRRIYPDIISPVTGKLEIISKNDQLSKGVGTVIKINVTNEGSGAQSYSVDVKDTLGYITKGRHTSLTLSAHESRAINVTLVGKTPESVTTVTAELASGGSTLQTQKENFLVSKINVPSISVTKETPPCAPANLNYYNCSNQNWTVDFTVLFDADMMTMSTPNSKVALNYFTKDNRTYLSALSGTCCNAKATIFVSDSGHNVVTKAFDLSDGAPFSTDVNLEELFQVDTSSSNGNTNKASKLSSNTTRLAVVLGAVMGVIVLTSVAIFAFIKIHSISVTAKPISMDQMYMDISSVERPELNGKIKYMHGH